MFFFFIDSPSSSSRALRFVSVLVFILAVLSSCGGKKIKRPTPTKAPQPVRIGQQETGEASWYGEPFHGRRSANGEVFDMHLLTAAHRTLPFDTWVRVRNLRNDKEVDVRITDRGPFVNDRIIDLSFAAAKEIDMVNAGVDRVRLRVIRLSDVSRPVISKSDGSSSTRPTEQESLSDGCRIQVASFTDTARAQMVLAESKNRFADLDWRIKSGVVDGRAVSRLTICGLIDARSAEVQLMRVKQSFPDAFLRLP
jgi:rare lipoprotein A